MSKILVTGGTGFIGSYVVDRLVADGHEVIALSRSTASKPDPRPQVKNFLGDIRDQTAVFEAVAHVEGFIHLAGVLGTQETIQNPYPAVDTNIRGGLNILEAAARYKVPGVNIAVGNFWENNPYSISKNSVERFADMYNRYRGTKVSTVRAMNAYGPRQSVASPYGCLDPNTPVLRADLTWVPIALLEIGDEVVALDEFPTKKHGQRRLRRATVTGSWVTRKSAVRIDLEDGRSVVCSEDHPWLSSPWMNTNSREWQRAGDLRVGQMITSITNSTWEEQYSREHGYIAGLLDGEAHINKGGVHFHQNAGPVLDRYVSALREVGYSSRVHLKESGRDCFTVSVTGGLTEKLRLLGETRPSRLIANSGKVWEGVSPKGGSVEIVAITPLGEMDLFDIETTEHTYVAQGLASHNSSKVRKIMPSFVHKALNNDPIEVYGSGHQIMDMVYVTDVADILVDALYYTMNHEDVITFGGSPVPFTPGVFEAGTGVATSVLDIAEAVLAEVYGATIPAVKSLPMRQGETGTTPVLADTKSLEPLYGNYPKGFVSLAEGVKRTVAYYRG